MMSEKIDIAGLNKADVLAALFNSFRPQGAGFLNVLTSDLYFDYVLGRVLKVDLSGDSFDPRLYDRDNGEGAALRTINALKQEIAANAL